MPIASFRLDRSGLKQKVKFKLHKIALKTSRYTSMNWIGEWQENDVELYN